MLETSRETSRETGEDSRGGLPEQVWARIARHSHRLLMLDFDGTLAPFVSERMRARLPAESLRALDRIVASAREPMAVISGRPLRELIALLPDLPLHLVGEHGWEQRMSNGVTWVHQPGANARWRLATAAHLARLAGCGRWIERKRASVVLHERGIETPADLRKISRVARAWRLLETGGGLHLDRTDGGFELRAIARGKHTAALGLLRQSPPGTLPVFIGDDVSDEDAFRVLRPLGITIHVGTVERTTAAEWSLASPHEVAEFLTRWTELIEEVR